MRSISAADAKRGFGELLDTAQREPVRITKKGRPVAVVLSREEYERFTALEDAWWGERAMAALKEGSLGVEASERLLRQYIDAAD